jgi:hypothetical protein
LPYSYIALRLAIKHENDHRPAGVVAEAGKHKALQNNTSLRALIISGLKKELASPMKIVSDPSEQIRNAGKELWRGIKADRYVRELRKNWK